jgi:hypothetical protein
MQPTLENLLCIWWSNIIDGVEQGYEKYTVEDAQRILTDVDSNHNSR